uniref:Transposase n=1 Tax=Macrostomum lignano TaxID=282301 RepID=A0A1I8IUI6_9PLAT
MLGIRHQIPMAGQERDSATSADSVYQSRPVSQRVAQQPKKSHKILRFVCRCVPGWNRSAFGPFKWCPGIQLRHHAWCGADWAHRGRRGVRLSRNRGV